MPCSVQRARLERYVGRWLKLSLMAIGALGAAVLGGFVWFSFQVFSYGPGVSAAGDAIVVLTGGELRVHEGLRLFAAGTGRRLLISGVNETTTRKNLWRQSSVAPILFDCCVDVDQRARDTAGNAREIRDWAEPCLFRRLVVVTSNYHMPRSLLTLRRALPDLVLVPHAVISPHYRFGEWWRHPGAVKLVAIEYMKSIPVAACLAWTRLTGRGASPPLSHPAGSELSSVRSRLSGL